MWGGRLRRRCVGNCTISPRPRFCKYISITEGTESGIRAARKCAVSKERRDDLFYAHFAHKQSRKNASPVIFTVQTPAPIFPASPRPPPLLPSSPPSFYIFTPTSPKSPSLR